MKSIFIVLFLGLTFNCFSQSRFRIEKIYPDSVSVLNDCKWQLSESKFKDNDGTIYDVFVDLGTSETFMIFRKKQKFAKLVFLRQ